MQTIINKSAAERFNQQLFSDLLPHQQLEFAIANGDNIEFLRSLYPRAKDNQIRFYIVDMTQDPVLAHKLFKQVPDSDKKMKLSLIKYLRVEANAEVKQLLLHNMTDFDAAMAIIDAIDVKTNRAFLTSLKNLGGLPEAVSDYIDTILKQIPIESQEDN